jgi:IS30 family transposase
LWKAGNVSAMNGIYQYVWKDKKEGVNLYTHLRHKGRKYRKRGNAKDSRGIIKNRIDISQRPEIVDQKQRMGDLGIDTMISRKYVEQQTKKKIKFLNTK